MNKWTDITIDSWLVANQSAILRTSPYLKYNLALQWKCTLCGDEWKNTWNHILAGQGCPQCSKRKKKNPDTINEFLSTRGFSILGEYKNVHTPTEFQCPNGHRFTGRFNNLRNGRGCPICSNHHPHTLTELHTLSAGLGVVLLSNTYSDSGSHLLWECSTCGNKWKACWDNIKQGYGCPQCSSGKHERQVGKLLMDLYGVVKPQFILNCPKEIRSSGKVRVDFFIPEIKTVIEYHGVQHYKFVEYLQKHPGNFDSQVSRDEWVRRYTEENNLNYIEIPYWENDDLEGFLTKELEWHLVEKVQ